MSLKTEASKTAEANRQDEKAAAQQRWEAELVKRREKLIEKLTPVATDENVALIAESLEVTYMTEVHDRGMFGSGSYWKPESIKGTHFQVDDLDVIVWWGARSMASSEHHVAVLKTCSRCENWCVRTEYGSPEELRTFYSDDEAKRTDLMKSIGDTLSRRTMCHTHVAEKVNASCRTCGRPYADV